MDNRPIGVFDSGLGGLTAVKELERLLPGEDIVYFGDTGRVPYGTRGHDTIKKYALQDIRFLRDCNVKAVIIACGTVSSVAFSEVSAQAALPVIGVVEPTAAAAVKRSRTGKIGVIATSATINSGAFKKTVTGIMPQAYIKSRACPLFVPLVENGYFTVGSKMAELAAHEYLDDFTGEVDTLILGCTHYPLLRGVIEHILPGVELVDAGLETAKAAALELSQRGMLAEPRENSGENSGGNSRFYVSDNSDFERLAGIFLEHEVSGCVEKIDIEKY